MSVNLCLFDTYGQAIKQIVPFRFRVRLEDFDVLEDLRVDLDFLVKSHRVFAQKVENDHVGRFQRDVLVSQ